MLEKIKTLSQLSIFCSMREEDIQRLCKEKNKFIDSLQVRKKNGGYRLCYRILPDLYKNLVRSINKDLSSIYQTEPYVHGFIKGKGIITNAYRHLDQNIIINLDIKDFFDSITSQQIMNALVDIGLQKEIIPIIFELVTVNEILPTGFSTSPTISNIVCREMDTEFNEFASKNGYTYTRYGDDITLSTKGSCYIKKSDLISVLNKHGFQLNERKYKIQKKGGNRYVTGLTVCEKDRPRIPKYIKKKLRQEIYYINKFGFESHLDKINEDNTLFPYGGNSMGGWIGYLKPLEPKLAQELEKMYYQA